MVLSDRSIKEEIARGRIVITPQPDESCIQPASVDIHLGQQLRVFRPWQFPHHIDLSQPLDGLTELVEIEDNKYFSLGPGQFVLGTTLEFIAVPDDLMARLEGKSSLGRIGLLIHSTAGFVDPGWRGHLTLELYNVSALAIFLYPRMKISQISFHKLTTPAERPYGVSGLGSKYQDQVGPTPTRYSREFTPQPPLLSFPTIEMREKGTPQLSRANYLREWLKNSKFKGSIVSFAKALDVKPKTVEDWIYRSAKPSPNNRRKLFELTKLPQFSTEGRVESFLPGEQP